MGRLILAMAGGLGGLGGLGLVGLAVGGSSATETHGIVAAARSALEIGTLLERETLMIDVALDMGHDLQRHAQASDRADEAAADYHVLCRHIAFERGALAENQRDARDVAMDLAIEMDLAFRRDVARDPQILADRRIANFSRSLGIDRVSKIVRHLIPPLPPQRRLQLSKGPIGSTRPSKFARLRRLRERSVGRAVWAVGACFAPGLRSRPEVQPSKGRLARGEPTSTASSCSAAGPASDHSLSTQPDQAARPLGFRTAALRRAQAYGVVPRGPRRASRNSGPWRECGLAAGHARCGGGRRPPVASAAGRGLAPAF